MFSATIIFTAKKEVAARQPDFSIKLELDGDMQASPLGDRSGGFYGESDQSDI